MKDLFCKRGFRWIISYPHYQDGDSELSQPSFCRQSMNFKFQPEINSEFHQKNLDSVSNAFTLLSQISNILWKLWIDTDWVLNKYRLSSELENWLRKFQKLAQNVINFRYPEIVTEAYHLLYGKPRNFLLSPDLFRKTEPVSEHPVTPPQRRVFSKWIQKVRDRMKRIRAIKIWNF